MFNIDPKILQALQKAGERMMNEARNWKINTPPSSFATGGYVPFEYPPFGGGINWNAGESIINPNTFRQERVNDLSKDQTLTDMREYENIPFYHECYNFKQDLTTSQRMRAFKFIKAIETAKEL